MGDDRNSAAWQDLSALPVVVESYEFERRVSTGYGYERVTTVIHLRGAGAEGLGEDISPHETEDDTLHVLAPELPLTGEWTLGALCERLRELDQWPVAPRWEPARRWRNWAFESAAVDLALNQAGRPLHEVVGRAPRPVRFVNSLGLGDPPTFDPIRRRLELHPNVRFKLDVTAAWTSELMDEVAATGAVEIVDFKGHYGLELPELPELLRMYERVLETFPVALIEDAHDLPEVTQLLAAAADRISYDAPITTVESLDAIPLAPVAVNIKPCRVGDMQSLLNVYATCDARGLTMYGGGMGELGIGRAQIQLLASLFHPDGPNDVAPSDYNRDTPTADLPPSPLPAEPAATGFRLSDQ